MVFVEHSRKWPLPNSKSRDLFSRAGVESCVIRLEGRQIDPEELAQAIEHASTVASALEQGLARVASAGGPTLAALRSALRRRPG